VNAGVVGYNLSGRQGTGDIVARTGDSSRVLLMRDVSLGMSPVQLDLDMGSAVDMQVSNVSLVPAGSSPTQVISSVWTGGGTHGLLHANVPLKAYGVPAAALGPGELNMVALVSSESGVRPIPYRTALWSTRDVTDRSIELPTSTADPPIVNATNGVGRLSVAVSWPAAPNAPLYYAYYGSPGANSDPPYRWVDINASQGFLEGSVDLSVPDLTGVNGWNPALELAPSDSLEWGVAAVSGAPIEQLVRWYPSEESTVLNVGWSGFATPQ
jgi:hypothetical protein